MTTPKTSPGRPRSDASRAAIIEATFESLREIGYERLTMDAVATKAGVGKATIYRWYPTKEDLVIEALTLKSCDREDFIPNTGSLASDMAAVVEHLQNNDPLFLKRKAFALTVSTLAGIDTLAQAYWDSYIAKKRSTYAILFERAKERGEMAKSADVELFLDLFRGYLLFGLLIRPGGAVQPQEKIISVINRLLVGFASE